MGKEEKQFYTEVFGSLPRGGPGSEESTRKAFSMLKDIPDKPLILDIGVGTGMSTLELTRISEGKIYAIDIFQEYLDTLEEKIRQEPNLAEKIELFNMSMDNISFEEEIFDIIWCEGSIFVIGIEQGLKSWKKFLKPKGYLGFSDLVWYTEDIPKAPKKFFDEEYPSMKSDNEVQNTIQDQGYTLSDSFQFPEHPDWWENLYNPLEQKLKEVAPKYQENPLLSEMLENTQKEIELFKEYSHYYGYIFYIIQKS